MLFGVAALAAAEDRAFAELATVRVTDDSRLETSLAASGMRLAWVSSTDLHDHEVVLFDAARSRDLGTVEPCPLTNPCSVASGATPYGDLHFVDGGLVWRSSSTVQFFDGAAVIDVPGSAGELGVSGSRVVWWGRDAASAPGVFMLDVARAVDEGVAEPCPATNPCRIAAGIPNVILYDGPRIGGSRVVWSDFPGGSSGDEEIILYDADLPADVEPFADCPATNPCFFTANDIGDGAPAVSETRVAWVRCPNSSDCNVWPDGVLISDGETTVELPDLDASQVVAIVEPYVVWRDGWGVSRVYDTRKPVESGFTYVGGSIDLLADGRMLVETTSDAVPAPVGIYFLDLRRPLMTNHGYYETCPDGNPCWVVEPGGFGWSAYSRDLIAWVACEKATTCYGASTGDVYYALPEAPELPAYMAAVVTLAARRRRAPSGLI